MDHETLIQDKNAKAFILAGSRHSIKNLGTKDSKIYFGYKSKGL